MTYDEPEALAGEKSGPAEADGSVNGTSAARVVCCTETARERRDESNLTGCLFTVYEHELTILNQLHVAKKIR